MKNSIYFNINHNTRKTIKDNNAILNSALCSQNLESSIL